MKQHNLTIEVYVICPITTTRVESGYLHNEIVKLFMHECDVDHIYQKIYIYIYITI